MKRIYTFCFLMLLYSCSNHKRLELQNAHQFLVDSFSLTGIDNNQVVVTLRQLINGEFVAMDLSEVKLMRFDPSGRLLSSKYLPIELSFPADGYIQDDSTLLVAGSERVLYKADMDFNKVKKYYFGNSLPFSTSDYYLGNFYLKPSDRSALLTQVWIPTPFGARLNEMEQMPQHVSFKLNQNDTAIFTKRLFERTKYSLKSFPRIPRSILKGDSIIYFFPNEDSLLIFDTKSNKYNMISIGNADFSRPPAFVISKMQDEKYVKQYNLFNCFYEGVQYNSITGNCIVYYSMPVDSTTIHDRLPILADKGNFAIILNKELKAFRRVEMPKGLMLGYSVRVRNGLAIPVVDIRLLVDSGKIKYYVYNL